MKFRDLSRDQRERIVDAGRNRFIELVRAIGTVPVRSDDQRMRDVCEATFIAMMERFDIEVSSS